jgi:hypothetical protein
MKEGKKKFCYFYCDLTARKRKSGKNQKIKKKTPPSLHHPNSLSSSAKQQPFWLQTFGENQRSVVSFFWTKSRTVIITTPP